MTDILILTPNMQIKDEFKPLVVRHKSDGLISSFRVLKKEERNPKSIRTIIRNYYTHSGIDYALLAGDWGEMPGETVLVTAPPWTDHIPTDQYYACLDNFPNDFVAEVYVGRAPVTNAAQAAAFVSKTLAYMDDTTQNHLKRVLMVSEKLDFAWGKNWMQALEGEYPSAFDISTLYEADAKWSAADLVTELNSPAGYHMVNHMGHGSSNQCMKLSMQDLDQLSNGNNNRYFILYSQACRAGAYDLFGCWTEKLVGNNAHGAVAAITNSREGFYYYGDVENSPSQIFHREFLRSALYGSETQRRLGVASQESRTTAYGYHHGHPDPGLLEWCYYSTNLFGDPAVTVHLP